MASGSIQSGRLKPRACSKPAVPNLFGTRNQLWERQFFYRFGWGGWFWCDSSALLLLCTWLFFAVVQSLSRVWLCNPWTAACYASLSFTISRRLLQLLSIESVMPSNHLILCCPLLLLYYSYTVIYNEIIIRLTIMQNHWQPWTCVPATTWSYLGVMENSDTWSVLLTSSHLLLCGLFPNRPWISTCPWSRGWGAWL